MTKEDKKIVEIINGMSGKRNPFEIFSDWVEMLSISISNACTLFDTKVKQERESRYFAIIGKYSVKEQKQFPIMTALLALSLESSIHDALGEIFMSGGMGSNITGQFFTPFHISLTLAEMRFREKEEKLLEPSCGSGASILAMAQVMKNNGMDYQNSLKVVAQDLDWRSVYMCYVQMSLLGIDGIAVQGDSLQNVSIDEIEASHKLYTPKKAGVLL